MAGGGSTCHYYCIGYFTQKCQVKRILFPCSFKGKMGMRLTFFSYILACYFLVPECIKLWRVVNLHIFGAGFLYTVDTSIAFLFQIHSSSENAVLIWCLPLPPLCSLLYVSKSFYMFTNWEARKWDQRKERKKDRCEQRKKERKKKGKKERKKERTKERNIKVGRP